MDVPSSSPRRLPPRDPTHQSQPASSPSKHINEVFPLAPPPPLHTRSNNESWDPQPSSEEFITPSSSPSKGNTALVEVLDRSLQLTPNSSPAKPQATPSKRMLQPIDEDGNGGGAGFGRMDDGRPSRKNNKENAPPFSKATEVPQRANAGPGLQRSHAQSRRAYDPFRDMTIDEIEKLSKPQVKRLKDVAHLC